MRRFRGLRRTETERQELIAELRRLRAAGVNVDRQEAIQTELRETFEHGWPEAPDARARRIGRSNGVAP